MYRKPLKPRKPQKCFNHCAIKYTIQPGDTIRKISSKFRVNIYDLKKYNNHIRNLRYLIPGDVLCIPKPKPYCSFIPPTANAPKDSYIIVAGLNGIYVLANLPPIEKLDGNFQSYYAYAVTPFNFNYTKLSCIGKNPTIWSGQLHKVELNPITKIYVSANNDENNLKPPGDLILFESI
ncbi:LysM peptidoglycan-binding domain-containing protein [Paramaledivibacter caminithermalis]|uniref:LysM domain-containing protein n=1 Tax=Paramaledivibacter caminithermalis (strain DSM 15212 / CIP 107654 / DViRD3) TaxID=1121301 RepID=A0A1M6NKJ7_PARC5|nr:LysM peptidoglycan-binding domain-containing protein [Paramaledivibacter caminithermalis]SHJ96213.1 LysM domain-containing protein [Paramaledivibacter caminithermalis DSM 15212]